MAGSFQLSMLRERIALGAAGGVALLLVLGGWVWSRTASGNSDTAGMKPHTPAARSASPLPTTLDFAASSGNAAQPYSASLPTTEPLMVHVTGAVKNPGVYKLHAGDRLNDAIHAAGGFKANAERDALNLADTVRDADQIFVPSKIAEGTASKPARSEFVDNPAATPHRPLIVRGTPVRVALAAAAATKTTETDPVTPAVEAAAPAPPDEPPAAPVEPATPAEPAAPPVEKPAGRVLGKPAPEPEAVPAGEEAAPVSKTRRAPSRSTESRTSPVTKSPHSAGGKSITPPKFKNPGDGVVHLNSAGASELEKLPGVGPAMSARILEYRQQIGRFTAVEQIMDVKGIGDKKFAKMRPFLAL